MCVYCYICLSAAPMNRIVRSDFWYVHSTLFKIFCLVKWPFTCLRTCDLVRLLLFSFHTSISFSCWCTWESGAHNNCVWMHRLPGLLFFSRNRPSSSVFCRQNNICWITWRWKDGITHIWSSFLTLMLLFCYFQYKAWLILSEL